MAAAEPKSNGRWTPAMAGVFVCLLMVGGAGWWMILSRDEASRLSNEAAVHTTSAGSAGVGRAEPTRAPNALSSNFRVDLKVEPSSAQIIFDGKEVARGQLQIELPRDGQFHEIRLVAVGYAPERLLFADAPPQREVVLERAGDEEEGDPTKGLPTRKPSRAAAPAARAGRTGNRQEAAPSLPEYQEVVRNDLVEATPPLRPATPESAPSVRIIEDKEPNVRVVE